MDRFEGDDFVKKLNRDMTKKGVLNILILVFFTILSYIFMQNKGLFEGFNVYHHVLWTTFVMSQFIYILYVLLIKNNSSSRVVKETYKLFTSGGFEPFKQLVILTDEDPIFGLLLVIIALIMPFPFNLKMKNEHKLLIALSKIGVFHLLAAILKHL
uniref:Uncharacterized protein n=1 Tax=viral metagenome TaxID=1070528 RepID=A0A6C0L0K0_9ZZZZ|tara:strand:+ start:8291 stop:8758 length:468 start_codon:yes stop_codon:yes gene_type:complete